MVPRGLEPRTLRLLAVRSNQLSYETLETKGPTILLGSNHNASIGHGREKGVIEIEIMLKCITIPRASVV